MNARATSHTDMDETDMDKTCVRQFQRSLEWYRLGEVMHGTDSSHATDYDKTCVKQTWTRHAHGQDMHETDKDKTCVRQSQRSLEWYRLGEVMHGTDSSHAADYDKTCMRQVWQEMRETDSVEPCMKQTWTRHA
ncbi:hypothetical protein RRG08_058418 [Elysia crispata]|uniref:Uncharacterized protein n=1 Tax=Elysia crispata TaxID=231223 RepID=A0AAE0XWY0_9GAST|nr:hypothetical protein RRG08_058418 [Elysia crispata]